MVGARAAALAASLLLAAVWGCGSGDEPQGPGGRAPPLDVHGPVTVAAAGDFGIERAGRTTLAAMGKAEADLYLGLGDFSYAGPGSEDRFCDLVHRSLGRKAPFELVSGNHEEDPGVDGRLDRFAACLPDRAGARGRYGTQYYLDVGRLARFILISPDLTVDRHYHYYGPSDAGDPTGDLAWLERTIDQAHRAGIRWVIVGMHKNCISVGEYYCDVYQDLFSALIEHRVDLVVSGHDHTYQRSWQLHAPRPGCSAVEVDAYDPDCVVARGSDYPRGAGSVFVVAGTGGAELYPVHPDDPEAPYFATAMGRNAPGARHGFLALTITSKRLAARFVGSTPGTFGDRFAITAGS